MSRLFEKASSKEDIQENKRRLLFKFYKHLKYSEINEDGETTYFPLEEVKEIDEVDPVNQVALKSNYTNVNISNVSRKLKKRIVNSVLNHSKRAKQIIEEWQSEREKRKHQG